MTIEEAIRKATEGGYSKGTVYLISLSLGGGDETLQRTYLDPLFWQSLGGALEWGKEIITMTMPAWKYEWHRFIDHLADGKTAKEFFETLK